MFRLTAIVTSQHYIPLQYTLTFHYTSLIFTRASTTLYCPLPQLHHCPLILPSRLTPVFASPVNIFLTLVLNLYVLPWSVPIAPVGSWFQSAMDLAGYDNYLNMRVEETPETSFMLNVFRLMNSVQNNCLYGTTHCHKELVLCFWHCSRSVSRTHVVRWRMGCTWPNKYIGKIPKMEQN